VANRRILLFGYGNHGRHIAQGLVDDGYSVSIVEENEAFCRAAQEDGFNSCTLIDMSKDEALEALEPMQYDQLVCVMDDEHYNVFLTLSLNALFPDTHIVAISDSIHTTKKLYMAGAKKVIDLYEVSANRIHSILERPVATQLLEDFVMSREGITFMEMVIPENSFLHGRMTDEINFNTYNVILVGLVDHERGSGFEFLTSGYNHKLDTGDVIVCMGEIEDLHLFKKLIAHTESDVQKIYRKERI
jgi:voltage-gated potassium channel